MTQILNIAGYKFITLTELPTLRAELMAQAKLQQLKGTILLSPEGINLTLAGTAEQITGLVHYLQQDPRFTDMTFRESYSTYQPFNHLRIKIKKEIITLRDPRVRPQEKTAPTITPEELKHWLDENRELTILDTRNDYEVRFGTFHNAVNLQLKDFGEFPAAAQHIARDKPVVMFCTGGIRCEKAALVMQNAGHAEVYQLEGGILNYFAKVGSTHYEGECFVFDQRIAVDATLQVTGTRQCRVCQGPVKQSAELSCPSCVNHLT